MAPRGEKKSELYGIGLKYAAAVEEVHRCLNAVLHRGVIGCHGVQFFSEDKHGAAMLFASFLVLASALAEPNHSAKRSAVLA